MKFGKHLLSLALPEWLASYLDYKALKRAIKVQAQTGSVSSSFSAASDLSPSSATHMKRHGGADFLEHGH
jgi:SPX domain protein involved in polyphosphate accumulation